MLVLAVFALAFVLLVCAVAFVGVVVVAPRTYAVKKRLGVSCGAVAVIIILALLCVLALIYHI